MDQYRHCGPAMGGSFAIWIIYFLYSSKALIHHTPVKGYLKLKQTNNKNNENQCKNVI